jgi:SWI/SNF chromatin-remodeling complex subunit SWI1
VAALDLSIHQPRTIRRIFSLILSPLADYDQLPRPAHGGIQDRTLPPASIECTLDVFSRLVQEDQNRKVLARHIDHGSLIHLFGAFLRLLPFTDNDLSVTVGSNAVLEPWMGYLERIMLCIYTVIFLARFLV